MSRKRGSDERIAQESQKVLEQSKDRILSVQIKRTMTEKEKERVNNRAEN